MSVKTIAIETNASGDFTYERRLAGVVRGISVTLDELETPNITITDGVWATAILSVTGLAADATYQPLEPATDTAGVVIANTYVEPVIFGSLKIVVASGGANKTGTIRLVFA